MRIVIQTPAFVEFYESSNERTKEKIDYILLMMQELDNVNAKFVKKLEGTDYYEMRISVDNEYRVILFTIDSPNFMIATKILLLNGFLKKSTKDYKTQIMIADKIITEYNETETECGKDSQS